MQSKASFSLQGLRIEVQILQDLSQTNYVKHKADLLIFVGNSPSIDHQSWKDLLKMKSLEEISFVVGVFRMDLEELKTCELVVFDFHGDEIVMEKDYNWFEIDVTELQAQRKKILSVE